MILKFRKKYPLPLWNKELNIGDKFIGICTLTKMKVEFVVIGYDRAEAMLNLAIISPIFPKNWQTYISNKSEHHYCAIKINLWDKGLEIVKYF